MNNKGNKYIRCIIILMITLSPALSQAQTQSITYELTARNLSLEAIATYPQKLISHQQEDSLHKIIVSTFAAHTDTLKRQIVLTDLYRRNKTYPDAIKIYLAPTDLTNFDHPEIKQVADSLFSLGDSLTNQLIKRALKYASKRIQYDEELASDLDQGRCTTLPVASILARGKGTCSEYTNLFIALARYLGIPCRMAVGYICMPEQNYQGSHAWAECYIDNYGWLAVDPQNAFMWYPPVAIKMFHGKDFLDCNIPTLPDMYPVTMKIHSN